jgi:hypothetical protein
MRAAAFGRLRGIVYPRLRAFQARYNAPTTAQLAELRARVDELRGNVDQLRAGIAELRAFVADLPAGQAELRADNAGLRNELAELQARGAALHDLQTKHLRLSRAWYADIRALRQKLIEVRRSEAYAATFENRNPLVSIPIATYNAAELLVERAIASVRAQTYEHWEVVVVGDGCTDDTSTRIEQLGDPRIRFVNLPFRTVYPDSPEDRWSVSGAAPWNRAVELCRGEWIAALDDDDEFLPGHIETLLDLALERRAEFAYGGLEQVGVPGQPYLFAFPPVRGRVGMQAAIYLRSLAFFECDTQSWAIEDTTDWDFIRRMVDAGVLMAAIDRPVARYYPSLKQWRA